MSLFAKGADFRNRLSGWFVDREFFMRANGQVRFLRFSAVLQRRIVGGIAAVIGLWLLITLGMAFNQFSISFERMALERKEARVQSAQERIADYRGGIDDQAKELKARQDLLESVSTQHFGENPAAQTATGDANEADVAAKKIGLAVPEAAGLALIEARQIRFAEGLTRIANMRSIRAAKAIRTFGLNPDSLAAQTESGTGGPFIPFFGGGKKDVSDPRFGRLADALQRMDSMEHALSAIPTSMPAAIMLMSSGFGYRHDPFTGAGAMHSGLDFKGPVGTPILAAAEGKVTYAAVMSGYGNCMEITHANGLVTRYAHLSGFNVALGQQVKRGVQIARMGSTGRSTGPHLHFEVRLNGQAVNPLTFLEANPDVLEVQTIAGNRGTPKS